MSGMYLCRRFRLRFTDVGVLPLSEAAPCALGPPPPPGASLTWSAWAWVGLAMSRSLGDHRLKKVGVTSEPEFRRVALGAEDKFVVLVRASACP
jgi:hypothetical protein